MESGQALVPGSLISESTRIVDLVFQDPFYVVYSAEATASGATIGITEYFPADLVARAPDGEVLLRSPELQDLFNVGRDRFMAEARALSALRHPSLIRYDSILSDHGTAFALHAAEEGQSVTSIVKSSKQPPPQDELDASVKQLVSALELLHSRDLIHANINPDSVLLRPEPLLIRFGATRNFLAAKMRKVNLAVTPGYSAPELHFADAKAHGPLCDIFSLAAVLYYIVTGRHPINVIARGLGHTMPPAAAVPFQKFRPEFLEAIDRGLSLDPDRRPQTIKAFGQMLLEIPEKIAPKNRQPALQMAASLAEGPPPSALPPNGPPSPVTIPLPKSAVPDPDGENDDDDDDDLDEHRDFRSGRRGLGILVLAVLLALLIPTGLWLLESQSGKVPEQSAHLEPEKGAASQSVSSPTEPAPPPAERPRGLAMAKAQAKQSDATMAAPAQP
ncbi:MAG TPA: protein kinase, partial [Geobacterales bacterium]|nr:protein kinase [Geobacterales bacterium]